ncbi:hypothetical protein D3C81_2323150 [compost metagenome]
MRAHPECANALSNGCKAVMVETIRINREDVGSGTVSAEDIDTLLTPPYNRAKAAIDILPNQRPVWDGK